MAQQKFKFKNKNDAVIGCLWIHDKCLDIKGADSLSSDNMDILNEWCEANLSDSQWKQLKTVVRGRRIKDNYKMIRINKEAHVIIKAIAEASNLSFSEVIIQNLGDKLSQSKPAEPEQAAEIVAAPIEQAPDNAEPAPADKPTDDTIELFTTQTEYNDLVEQLKAEKLEWKTNPSEAQNLSRIFKGHGVLLPSGKMNKEALMAYIESKGILTTTKYKTLK